MLGEVLVENVGALDPSSYTSRFMTGGCVDHVSEQAVVWRQGTDDSPHAVARVNTNAQLKRLAVRWRRDQMNALRHSNGKVGNILRMLFIRRRHTRTTHV